MRLRTVRLGRVSGTELRVDVTWLAVAALATWSLATRYFPVVHDGWAPATHWLLAALATLLLLASLLAHELGHVLVSGGRGLLVPVLTLRLFGSRRQCPNAPQSWRDAFAIAVAGPLTSLSLAVGFGAVWWASRGRLDELSTLCGWLAWANAVVAAVHLLPAVPLDGAELVSAVVWRSTLDQRRGQQIAGATGQIVGLLVMVCAMAVVSVGSGLPALGLTALGFFLFGASTVQLRAERLRAVVSSHTVQEAMATDCPSVAPHVTLDTLARDVMVPTHWSCVLVVDQDRALGLVTGQCLREVPRYRWRVTSAREVMIAAEAIASVPPDAPLGVAVERLAADGRRLNVVPVVGDGRIVGVVTPSRIAALVRSHPPARHAAR